MAKDKPSRWTDDFVLSEYCRRFASWNIDKQAGAIHAFQTIMRCQGNDDAIPAEPQADDDDAPLLATVVKSEGRDSNNAEKGPVT